MTRVLPKSLFSQLILGTILVQTLLLLLFIWYTVVSQRRGGEQRSRDRIVQQLNRLSAACSIELEHNDMKAVHTALELSRIAPTIDVARLTDLDGRTLAVTASADDEGLDPYESAVLPTATQQQIFTIKNGQMEAVTPVLVQGRPVALLWLEPNHAVSQTTANLVVRIAIAYGGFALLANLLPIFLIVRTVTRPLQRLRAAARPYRS